MAELFGEIELALGSRQAADVIKWLVDQPRSSWPRAAKWAVVAAQFLRRRDKAVEAITEKNRLKCFVEASQQPPAALEDLRRELSEAEEKVDEAKKWVLEQELWIRQEAISLIEEGVDAESWHRLVGPP